MQQDEALPALAGTEAGGEPAAELYDELRRIARRQFRREGPGHTLQPTAVVHEAYLRLAGAPASRWRDRGHFLAAASRVIRHVLVNHARDRARQKRGGGLRRTTWIESRLEDLSDEAAVQRVDVLALDGALEALAGIDPGKARIVELRFFAGLTVDEVAAELGLSVSTVQREWRRAQAWLYRSLQGGGPLDP